jgi:hypothetical protein
VADDKNAIHLLKPYIRGRDIKRWQVVTPANYLVKIESSENVTHPWTGKPLAIAESIFSECYPSIYKHLSQYRKELIARSDQGTYFWELRSCAYWSDFEKTKIVYPDIALDCRFAFETGGYLDMTSFSICPGSLALIGILNSSLISYIFPYICATIRGGFLRFKTIYVEQIPMPNMSSTKSLEVLVGRILIAKSKDPKADVTKLERQIDQLVYQLYNLTPEEIKIIEGQTGG